MGLKWTTGYQGMYKVRVTKSLGFPLFFNAVARLLLYSYKTSVSLHILLQYHCSALSVRVCR